MFNLFKRKKQDTRKKKETKIAIGDGYSVLCVNDCWGIVNEQDEEELEFVYPNAAAAIKAFQADKVVNFEMGYIAYFEYSEVSKSKLWYIEIDGETIPGAYVTYEGVEAEILKLIARKKSEMYERKIALLEQKIATLEEEKKILEKEKKNFLLKK